MSQVRRLEVRLAWSATESQPVGVLAQKERRLFFEYDSSFLRNSLGLSPFKLPPQSGLIEHRDRDFGPIFGLFDDSLPDGWGLLLMDRFLRKQGRVLEDVSVLDRLAYLGGRTMGCLTYYPPAGEHGTDPQVVDLHELSKASIEVLRGSTQEVLPQLLRAGGSPGGARPKVLVGIGGDEMLSGEDDLPAGYRHWMIKFHGSGDEADSGVIEEAYARMARDAGIDMPQTRLFETAPSRSIESDRFFGVERFDRDADRRHHVHTFGNLIHSDFRVPSCDYQQLLEVSRILTKDRRQVEECYRRMVFNVLSHNRDDHVKNFAFAMTRKGDWQLAPAYDLTYSTGPGGEHSMTVAGEGRKPTRGHMMQLAAAVDISAAVASRLIEEVAAALNRWPVVASDLGVGKQSIARIREAISGAVKAARA